MKAHWAHVSYIPTTSFRARFVNKSALECVYHFHTAFEITYIGQGHGQRLIGDNLAAFGAGDLVLIGPKLPHAYFHPPGFEKSGIGVQLGLIIFPTALAEKMTVGIAEMKLVRRLLNQASRGLVFGADTAAKAAIIIEQIPRALAAERYARLIQLLHLLSLDQDARPIASAGFQPISQARCKDKLDNLCQWITDHISESITLRDVAREAGMTIPSFCRFFKRSTGRTFNAFLHELRIGHACRLLVETDLPVSQIAFQVGYNTLSNFNRCFQLYKRASPARYRRSTRPAITEVSLCR
jgi:AraC-like DNA-binding protein